MSERYLPFLFASLLFGLIPGPSVCFTIAYAIRHGLRRTVPTILGQALANLLQLTIIVFGLGGILTHTAQGLAWIKGIGALYLLYLGLRMFLAPAPDLSITRADTPGGWPKALTAGLIVCGTNPKALIYYAAFLPQFVSPRADSDRQLALLGVSSLIIGVLILTFYALLAGRVRH